MCLESVDEVTKRKRVGYKVMTSLSNGMLMSLYFGDKPVWRERWIRDKKQGLITDRAGRVEYPAGFHVYADKQAALSAAVSTSRSIPTERKDMKLAVVKVRMRRVVASGKSHLGEEVIVCRELFIEPDIKG